MSILTKLYVFALVLGGILLAASIFGGGEHHAGADGDADLATTDHEGPHHGDVSGFAAIFLSLRFWTFFSAFFGLTGLVFGGLHILSPLPTLGLSAAVGFAVGGAASAAIRYLGQADVGEVPSSGDYVGQTARVLLPFGRGETGKVRLTLKGTLVDMLASTDEERPFEAGEQALVVEMQGTTAYVSRIAGDGERDTA